MRRVPTSRVLGAGGAAGSQPPRARGRHAFTLLEVLLAIGVAAIVLIAVNGIFFGALRLRNKTTRAIEETLPLQRTLIILERDLANIVPPGGTLSGILQTTANLPLEQGQVGPDFYTASARLEEQEPWGEIQRVAYVLRESTNGASGRDLYRSVTRNLLPPAVEMPFPELLMGGVEDLSFEFFDGTQWRSDWDSSAETTPLPQAIKVELQLAAADIRDELPPPVELIIPFLVDGTTNAPTEASGGAP